MINHQLTRFRTSLVAAALLAVAFLSPLPEARACPFCGVAQMTLTEMLAQADAAVLVQWVGGEKDTEAKPGFTTYQIQQVVKGPGSDKPAKAAATAAVTATAAATSPAATSTATPPKGKSAELLVKDKQINLDRYRTSKPGDLFFLLGTDIGDGKGIEWGSPLEVSETSFNYMVQAPSPEAPPGKRLAYFLKFLEFPDPVISNDAFGEFANAQYKDIEQLASQLPKEKIRHWITSPETQATRLGLYGMMIGLCGDDVDAANLEKRILVQTDEFRLGIDGLMGGYLLLTRDKGLDILDQHKLLNKKIPFSETFAAMQALRFMWSYGSGKIAPERLQQSMRLLLDRPEMADLVIADLARWKDWSLQDKLMKMYGEGEYNVPSIKRAIVRYMLVSSKDVAMNAGGVTIPPHAANGLKYLEELRKKDPKTVSEAERFFVVP